MTLQEISRQAAWQATDQWAYGRPVGSTANDLMDYVADAVTLAVLKEVRDQISYKPMAKDCTFMKTCGRPTCRCSQPFVLKSPSETWNALLASLVIPQEEIQEQITPTGASGAPDWMQSVGRTPEWRENAFAGKAETVDRVIRAGAGWCAVTHQHDNSKAAIAAAHEALTILDERIISKVTPALNHGKAMDALALVGAAIRELRVEIGGEHQVNTSAERASETAKSEHVDQPNGSVDGLGVQKG
jgi:hypothetical protein